MDELQVLGARHLYLSRYCHHDQPALFIMRLSEELEVPSKNRHFLDIKECVIPRVRVRVPMSDIKLNESNVVSIPQLEIDDIDELIDAINIRLPSDFKPMKYVPADNVHPLPRVEVTLSPGQSIRTSEGLADLIFENKTFMRNNRNAKDSEFAFKIRKDFQTNTYYLTCDCLERLPVGKAQLPLLNSLTVNYLGKENHANLQWENIHEKAFLRPGTFRQLIFRISDRKGETVKLNEGLLFLHARLCT